MHWTAHLVRDDDNGLLFRRGLQVEPHVESSAAGPEPEESLERGGEEAAVDGGSDEDEDVVELCVIAVPRLKRGEDVVVGGGGGTGETCVRVQRIAPLFSRAIPPLFLSPES